MCLGEHIFNKKRIGYAIFLAIVVALILDINFFYLRKFDTTTAVDIQASEYTEIIQRGAYLVYGPARCADCHGDPAQREAIARGEIVPLSGGLGEDIYLGNIRFPNITPDKETGIGALSDAQLAYFFRTGINHRGEYGLPFMNNQNISDDDLLAIISFLRSQKPVKNEVEPSSYNFLGKLALAYFIRPKEQSAVWESTPEEKPSVENGRYIVEAVASCRECHTNRSLITGEYQGAFYAGGMVFDYPDNPDWNTVSPGLIPEPDTSTIAGFSKEQFIARMQAGRLRPWSPMPWGPYSRMKQEDIESIYLYLSTLKMVPE